MLDLAGRLTSLFANVSVAQQRVHASRHASARDNQ